MQAMCDPQVEKHGKHSEEDQFLYLTIRLRARVFYKQIVNEAQPSWLLLVENEGE